MNQNKHNLKEIHTGAAVRLRDGVPRLQGRQISETLI